MGVKLITLVTACFNEKDNVRPLEEEIRAVFAHLPQYRYEHIFIDNASTDGTQAILRQLAEEDARVKVIFNTRNFGPVRSPFHGMIQGRGDAVIGISADFQDPPAMIPDLLARWEAGFPVVLAVKTESEESPIVYRMRSWYYRLLLRLSDVQLVRQSTGFGCYDAKVIELMRQINDPYPFTRGLVAEIGYEVALLPFRQPKRRHGKSKLSLYTLFDVAWLGIMNHSKFPLRLATLLGFVSAAIMLILAFGYLVAKLVFWNQFSLGIAPILIGFFLFSSIQLFFVGVLGEYIGAIFTQVKNRPLVFEKERLNF